MTPHPFPVARYVGLAWFLIWVTAYAWWYGLLNFLQLCDISIAITCLGLWRGSALILSTQAVSALVVHVVWLLDVSWRAATGRHLIGGTEYMWDTRYPLWLRLMSFFHVVWPVLLVWALRRVGYDRRALVAQSVLAALVMVASRFTPPELNLNFAFLDPLFGRAWGPAPLHVASMTALLVTCIYWPTHLALRRWLPAAGAILDPWRSERPS
jgi:hypothetical protein